MALNPTRDKPLLESMMTQSPDAYMRHPTSMGTITRSGAAADGRTGLKLGAQLDLTSPYAVPRTGRTESFTSLNYAKLCVELNQTGAVIGEMWGDLATRHIVFE